MGSKDQRTQDGREEGKKCEHTHSQTKVTRGKKATAKKNYYAPRDHKQLNEIY